MDLREARGPAARRHPWETARFDFFRGELQRSGILERARSVLDVGSGDAWFSAQLAPELRAATELVCFDANYREDQRETKVGSCRVVQTRIRPTRRFELMLLMDVLEHVEDDLSFLSSLVNDQLEPGGVVLISVPAWMLAWTPHDEFLGHFRRYAPAQGKRLIENAGLRITRSGGLFHSLLPARLAQKALRGVHAEQPEAAWNAGAAVTMVVSTALKIDNAMSRMLAGRRVELPGLSWWALCER